jgi:hypothetical protein
MNMLALVLGITVMGTSVLIVMERQHFIRRTLQAWEKRIKNFYACEGLLLYGIAFLKEKGVPPPLPHSLLLEQKASLICKENANGTKMLEASLGDMTIGCTIQDKEGLVEIVSWDER